MLDKTGAGNTINPKINGDSVAEGL